MSIKNLSGNKKGQLIVCCIILGVVWGVLLLRFGSAYLKDLPNKSKIEKARKELEKSRREFEKSDKEKLKTHLNIPDKLPGIGFRRMDKCC